MKNRREAREKALHILYSIDLLRKKNPEKSDKVLEEYLSTLPEGKESEYLFDVVNGVLKFQKEIDNLIQRTSERWKLDRMAVVDRNILRLAVYEMLFRGDIPLKVSINEAVELAKKFGDKDSSAFVNGILDGIAKQLKKV